MSCLSYCSCSKRQKGGKKMDDDEDDNENHETKSKRSYELTRNHRHFSVTEVNAHVSRFLTEKFSRKECTTFTLPPHQSKCICGGDLKDHRFTATVDNILPGTVDKDKIIPVNDGPRVKIYPTNAFGKIEFLMDGRGLLKMSKYVRLSDDTDMKDVVSLIQDYWKMNEPSLPQFVISITGSGTSLLDRPEWKEQFGESLVQSSVAANAWLFTSGLHFGLTKVIGEAIGKKQNLIPTKDRMINLIRCIGIANWGCVEGNEDLINKYPTESHYARYQVRPYKTLENGRAYLNPFHTHFLLVDDGTRGIYNGVANFRAELMRKISAPEKEKGLAIPSLLLVVGGDLDSINEIVHCLQNDIPVLLVCGTCDLCDVLNTAISCSFSSALGEKYNELITEDDHKVLRNMLSATYKNELEKEPHLLDSVLKDIYKCIRKKNLIQTYKMNGEDSLDHLILLTAIMNKKGSSLQDQLLLAVKWDRTDVAEKLFSDCSSWPQDMIKEAMTVALLENKLAFVKLLLKRGIVMRKFLTVGLLRRLYNETINENYSANMVLKDICNEERTIYLSDVTKFLSRFFRKHRYDLYQNDLPEEQLQPTGISDERFGQPFRELFIWAVVVLRTDMALFFWSETRKPLQMALAATAFYWRLNVYQENNDDNSEIMQAKKEFENIAIGVLEECSKMCFLKTHDILNFRDKYWGNMTSLDLAVMACDRAFMSTPPCIGVTYQLWCGQISPTSIWRMSITIFNPLLLAVGYIRFRPDSKTLKKPNFFQKVYFFYTSPVIKMIALFYSYLCYLMLFAYVVLFQFHEEVGWPEVILHIWMLSLILDIFKEICRQPSEGKDSKLKEWLYGYFWNKLDVVWVATFFVGFICRIAVQHPSTSLSSPLRLDDVHLIYTISCSLSFIRLYEFYMTMPHLGPKLILLKRMIPDLIVFFLIAAVCMLCYGVARVSLLHREDQPLWEVLKEVIALPYWHLYGEMYLGDESGRQFPSCIENPSSCRESPHSWIVSIMLAIYMLIGNILLVNMLIAVFTHIFEGVNAHSKEIYFFEMYNTGLQFSRRSVLTPPFLLIEDVLLGIFSIFNKAYRKIYAKCCCVKEQSDDKGEQEQLRRAHVDHLRLFVKEARSKYLKKSDYGKENSESRKVEQRIVYLSDLVRNVHQMLEESKRKPTEVSAFIQSPPQIEVSSWYPFKINAPGQEFIEDLYESDNPSSINKGPKIVIQNADQQLDVGTSEMEYRLLQVEIALKNISDKLEGMDQNISQLSNQTSSQ